MLGFAEYDVAEDFSIEARIDKGLNEAPSPKPHKMMIQVALEFLSGRWPQVVGRDFARITMPIGFEGNKKGRLIVAADPAHLPPWGHWDADRNGGYRHASTRRMVNRALWPLKVIELVFDTDKWNKHR